MLSSFLSPKSFSNHLWHLKWKLTDVTIFQMSGPPALYTFWKSKNLNTLQALKCIDFHHYQNLFNWPTMRKQIQYLALRLSSVSPYTKNHQFNNYDSSITNIRHLLYLITGSICMFKSIPLFYSEDMVLSTWLLYLYGPWKGMGIQRMHLSSVSVPYERARLLYHR